MEISVTQQALLYLLNCAVNERVPEELPEELDFEELYKLSKFHSVCAMVSYVLDKGGYLTEKYMSQEMVQKWAAARISAIRKNLMFDAEREQILQWMEEVGCWYMPLKGVILKDMYPDVGMREMCDNDILFDKKFRKQLKEYMISLGYETSLYEKYIHDTYVKKPFFAFEFHAELFADNYIDNWSDYYADIEERLHKDENYKSRRHFSDEDYYIHVTAHTYQHYRSGGTGIRSFVDTYVFLKKKSDMLNWKYISNELKKIKLYDFEKNARNFAEKIFDKTKSFNVIKKLNINELEMALYILHAGTYGNIDNSIKNRILFMKTESQGLRLRDKFKYSLRRIYPGMGYIKTYRPFIYKHKVLIPFFVIYRIISRPFINGKQLIKEIKMLIKMK